MSDGKAGLRSLIPPVAIANKFVNHTSNNIKAAAVLVVAGLFFSIMSATIKLAGQTLHVTQILLIRQLGMLLIMSPQIIASPRESYRTGRLDLQMIRLGLALVAMLGGFTALIHMPLADATALGFAKSFFVTIFAVIILKELVGPYRWFAVVVGFIGVLIMLRPGSDGFTIYSIYAVISAACAGAVMVVIRLLSRTETTHTIMVYQATGVAIVMLIPAWITWQQPTVWEWVLLAVIGFTAYIGQRLNVLAFTWGEASLLASLDYMRLIYAVIIGFFLFGNLPHANTLLGAIIIVAAAVFTVHRESRRKQALASASDGRGFTNN